MEAIMRAYIVIGTLAVLAVSARIYTAHTQDRLIAGLNCTVDCSGYDAGYKWAKQRDIDDDATTVQMAINLFMKAVPPTQSAQVGPPTKPIAASARPYL